ncbi:hypothetical protein NECAME_00405 [Necator americanus]|uniref:Serpin domain-containing protein n=1 Tax=Necator americanus TaxID=51031 RepID=W2TAZ2_NECAM|nr:hypothetical protein NECAME_00405 [Necator americanus]ETN79028.1 hypothetical protein NECAME_00405 [Necator americanus]
MASGKIRNPQDLFKVSEEGTEAAAATGMVMMMRSRPISPDFFADQPFVYGIFHGEEPIFIGQFC